MTSEELGQDLEHVEVLQKKFEEFQTDLAAHEERVNEVNQFAGKLIQVNIYGYGKSLLASQLLQQTFVCNFPSFPPGLGQIFKLCSTWVLGYLHLKWSLFDSLLLLNNCPIWECS